MKDTKKAADFIISIILIALSAFLYMTADKMPGATKGIGPGDYPKFICTILFILGVIQLISVVVSCKGIPLIASSPLKYNCISINLSVLGNVLVNVPFALNIDILSLFV